MSFSLSDTKRKRFEFLKALYHMSEFDTFKDFSLEQVNEKLNFDEKTLDGVATYLADEGLIQFLTFAHVSITHRGIKEVERALDHPNEPTQYFPPVNVIHIESMNNSQIQQGTTSSTQVGHFNTSELDLLRQLLPQLQSLREDPVLTDEQRAELASDVGTIELQLASPKPKNAVIRESLRSIRTVAEEASGSLLASAILPHVTSLLGGQ